MLDFGIGSPAMLAKACNVGSSTSSDRGLLFRKILGELKLLSKYSMAGNP
jgi:hypothetical protein